MRGVHHDSRLKFRRTTRLLPLLLLAAILLAGCGEDGRYGITFVNQGNHVVGTNQQLISDVAIAGGAMSIEMDAELMGTVYVFGGELTIDGRINGDVAALGGSVWVADSADITGDFLVAGSEVERSPASTIGGDVTVLDSQEFATSLPSRSVTSFLWQLVTTTLLLGALAGLTVKLMPTLTNRVSATSMRFPLVSAALGTLLLLVLPILLVFMAFTIVLIPATLVGAVVLALLIGYGIIGLGRGVGERIAHWRSWQVSPELAAMLGTSLLILVLNLVGLIPIVGEISLVIAGAIGIGSVVLSGFGRRIYEPPTYDVEPEVV